MPKSVREQVLENVKKQPKVEAGAPTPATFRAMAKKLYPIHLELENALTYAKKNKVVGWEDVEAATVNVAQALTALDNLSGQVGP